MNEMIIILLCVVIGLLIAVLCFGYFKSKSVMTKKSKKKIDRISMEFSKKILIASYVIAAVVIVYTMYIVHLMVVGGYTGDPSSLNTLILMTLGELGAANSFYFWKSKFENKFKLEAEYGRKIIEENGDDIV